MCPSCYEKQLKIDHLEEEVSYLKQKLRYEERKTKDGYFGSSTPSAERPFKENTAKAAKKNRGAKKGHMGHGRRSIGESEADIVEFLEPPDKCPDCNTELEVKGVVERTVIDIIPAKVKKMVYKCIKKWCPCCRKTIIRKPVILPKSLYGNQLIAHAAVLYYGHGVPLNRVEEILGNVVKTGSLYDMFHRVARLWQPALPRIIEEYRQAPAKHADETGWRNNGHSGFAWIFCAEYISIFQFKDSRSASIPRFIMGAKRLPGTLVVDRYSAYNKLPCKLQYCYAHLLRKVEDTGKKFIDNPEVQTFVNVFAALLSKAMHLRTLSISDKIYYKRAGLLKKRILKAVNSGASHWGIKEIQRIFKENKSRLYHWVTDRRIPAENNKAERELRPTVIARKVSFGSQSERGASTRSILMTVLHTAQKRLTGQSLEDWFRQALDKISLDHNIDPYLLLPPHPP
mgnify:FL=1